MNMYLELKKQQEKEMNNFPIIFAFSKKQLIEGKEKLGLKETDKNKLLSIGGGGFIRKSDEKALDNLLDRHNQELKKAIDEDLTGEGFIYDMFNYELANHERGTPGYMSKPATSSFKLLQLLIFHFKK